ncbi:MAG: response regulator transcription factor [Chitinophagales bacterium]|nr:response regulator transcription factor [Chitinophagales bacterium]
MKAIIVEDEISVRNDLKGLLKAYTNINLVGECGSIASAKSLIASCNPEVVFLDIHLEDGNVFSLLNQLEHINFKIIFTTAYDEFAIKALRLGAIDYLLKPVDPDELHIAIEKLNTTETIATQQINNFNDALNNNSHKIILKNSDGIHIINFNDINFCQSDGPYTTFYLNKNQKIVISKPLKNYEQILPSHLFVRCHQSYLVNINNISKLNQDDTIILKDKTQIPVSTRKKDAVLKAIQQLK